MTVWSPRVEHAAIGRISRAIVGHPGLQALGFVAALNSYIWWVEPAASDAERMLAVLFLTALPICSNLLHRDRRRDMGIRLDNLFRSGRDVGTATVICSRSCRPCSISRCTARSRRNPPRSIV